MLVKENELGLPDAKDEFLLLHNPNCSKSRATLSLLEKHGLTFRTRLYLDDPLGREELVDLGRRLDMRAYEFARPKQPEFADAGLDPSSSEDSILDVVAATPILLERPILIRGMRAAIGRPPENVLSLLDD